MIRQDTNAGQEHVSVCICTYQRPGLLEKLLGALNHLATTDRFTYSVVIVDNDASGSAKPAVDRYASGAAVPVRYDVEPERSFARVRNRAVENARGSHVAFIDDDECPGPDWLLSLFRAMKDYQADGVLGPVIPDYEVAPPEWLIKGRLCERETFRTGTVLTSHAHARTGNVLLNRSLFVNNRNPFDPRFGKLGGEDGDFFKRMMSQGKRFVWCNEAPVREWVPWNRIQRVYFLKRALMRGYLESKDMHFASYGMLKSCIAVILYTAALPVFTLMGQHVLMAFLIKACDHLGKILGACGVTLFRERSF